MYVEEVLDNTHNKTYLADTVKGAMNPPPPAFGGGIGMAVKRVWVGGLDGMG